MARRRRHEPLRVYLNNRLVGWLTKEAGGAIAFQYGDSWLDWEHTLPISLSLPLRESVVRGEQVVAVFDNLLPDGPLLRRRIAERVGARDTDAYGLLAAIGHDCVGALQFLTDRDDAVDATPPVEGDRIEVEDVEKMLRGLAQAPLGLSRDDDFRISIAGTQEKTALLRHEGHWLRPRGATATTHILKPQIGRLPNGIDLSDSVENEFYCLKLVEACGLPVNEAAIETFGETKALVVTRFDRQWTRDRRLLRLPQEDCCQALSVPSAAKYQSDGGPGMVDILGMLKGSDTPQADQATFIKAQALNFLFGATDGHAKNFSIFLSPGGTYRLTPLYDVLSAQMALDRRQIERKQMKLAMSVGTNRHYRMDEIVGRHFVQTAVAAGVPRRLVADILDEVRSTVDDALVRVEAMLPPDFPERIHRSIKTAVRARLPALTID